ncbi:BLUF domain-containing protein [Roseibacterium sp. SDUM158017]|nr:BLUF domain-containing protein [Roseibacterium sp. SDUM158017]MDG4650644.1 BLUF domain-containing protein [Roseibacterium sp. SDUM158017]
MVYQLAYCSVCLFKMAPEFLDDILNTSARNNLRDHISGILMYHDQLFFQVLEGEKEKVDGLFRRIQADSRHTSIALMWTGEVNERCFSEWAMGFAGPAEILSYTNGRMVSLAELKSRRSAKASNGVLALNLAEAVFNDFLGQNRFGNARTEPKKS